MDLKAHSATQSYIAKTMLLAQRDAAKSANLQGEIASAVPDAGFMTAETEYFSQKISQVNSKVFAPTSAPSADGQSSRQMGDALWGPRYVHNIAQTKQALLSNMHRDAPRFGAAVNMIA